MKIPSLIPIPIVPTLPLPRHPRPAASTPSAALRCMPGGTALRRGSAALACSLAALLFSMPGAAQDLSISGFGTAGYAISDRAYSYQRSVNNRGTFNRDSVLGLQGDLRFNPQWSATVQLKAGQALDRDGRWDLTPAWAFVAWRPADDWLLRVGKMRIPLYLHSESLDVGITYEMARLPDEMYTIAPSNDFNGATISKTWPLGDSDLTLDVYGGSITTTARFWTRDGLQPDVLPGATFVDVKVKAGGAVLSLRQPHGIWRASLFHARTSQTDGSEIPVRFPFVSIGNGLGYYKVSEALPGPPLESTRQITNDILTLGVEQEVLPNWRVAAEFARDIQHKTEVASDTTGGYVALFHSMGRATPYVSYGFLKSGRKQTDWYQRLTETTLPAIVPGAAQINCAQRLSAETIYAIDQRTLAVGTSFSIDSHQMLKVELARTSIGRVSRLVDALPGQPVPRDTHLNVFSLSYSFSF